MSDVLFMLGIIALGFVVVLLGSLLARQGEIEGEIGGNSGSED